MGWPPRVSLASLVRLISLRKLMSNRARGHAKTFFRGTSKRRVLSPYARRPAHSGIFVRSLRSRPLRVTTSLRPLKARAKHGHPKAQTAPGGRTAPAPPVLKVLALVSAPRTKAGTPNRVLDTSAPPVTPTLRLCSIRHAPQTGQLHRIARSAGTLRLARWWPAIGPPGFPRRRCARWPLS